MLRFQSEWERKVWMYAYGGALARFGTSTECAKAADFAVEQFRRRCDETAYDDEAGR
jgi:hypothetical protein